MLARYAKAVPPVLAFVGVILAAGIIDGTAYKIITAIVAGLSATLVVMGPANAPKKLPPAPPAPPAPAPVVAYVSTTDPAPKFPHGRVWPPQSPKVTP